MPLCQLSSELKRTGCWLESSPWVASSSSLPIQGTGAWRGRDQSELLTGSSSGEREAGAWPSRPSRPSWLLALAASVPGRESSPAERWWAWLWPCAGPRLVACRVKTTELLCSRGALAISLLCICIVSELSSCLSHPLALRSRRGQLCIVTVCPLPCLVSGAQRVLDEVTG